MRPTYYLEWMPRGHWRWLSEEEATILVLGGSRVEERLPTPTHGRFMQVIKTEEQKRAS